MNEQDFENLKWLHVFKYVCILISTFALLIFAYAYFIITYLRVEILFSKYDLYSKSKVLVDVEEVKPYYLSLIEKVRSNSGERKFLSIDYVFFYVKNLFSGGSYFAVFSCKAEMVITEL